jgi:hypothetical protein
MRLVLAPPPKEHCRPLTPIMDDTCSCDDDEKEEEEGVEVMPATPSSPSSVTDITFIVVENHTRKKILVNSAVPAPFVKDRSDPIARKCDKTKLQLTSVFDKTDDCSLSVDLTWSDDDEDTDTDDCSEDEDDEPRGLRFLIDDCSSSMGGADCTTFGCNQLPCSLYEDVGELPRLTITRNV